MHFYGDSCIYYKLTLLIAVPYVIKGILKFFMFSYWNSLIKFSKKYQYINLNFLLYPDIILGFEKYINNYVLTIQRILVNLWLLRCDRNGKYNFIKIIVIIVHIMILKCFRFNNNLLYIKEAINYYYYSYFKYFIFHNFYD